jgi:hypothetical protein
LFSFLRVVKHKTPKSVDQSLELAPATASPQQQALSLAFPWMLVTDTMLEWIGFLLGHRVMLSIGPHLRQDHHFSRS